jgi:hypothetical protein
MRTGIFLVIIICLIGVCFDKDEVGLMGNPKGYTEPEVKSEPIPEYPYKLYPKDTTPYKGNYVDIQNQ